MPDFSIILPAYRSAAFLAQTLDGVLAQTDPDFELIVVDDGSPDDSAAIVSACPDPRVCLIRRHNGGIAAARNSGIAAARGKWIAFLDHDDYWHPGKLALQRRLLEAHPEFGVVFSEFSLWNGESPADFPDPDPDPEALDSRLCGFIYPELLQTNWVLFTTAVFRREVFETVGLFDESLPPADDWDLALRASRSYRFGKQSAVLARYRQHSGQTSRKLMAGNPEFELRRRFIAEYGLTGPDGRSADRAEIRLREARSEFHHGLNCYCFAQFRRARAPLFRAWIRQPENWRALAYLLLSIACVRAGAAAAQSCPAREAVKPNPDDGEIPA